MNIHLYPSVLKNETRILKIARSLRAHGVFSEIGVVGRDGPGLPAQEDLGDGIYLFRLTPIFGSTLDGALGKVVRTLGWYLAVLGWMRSRRVQCLNCHSLPVLPLSVLLKLWKHCVLVYDTHELETETNGSRGVRKRIAKLVERTMIRFADAVCVVNQSIGAWYEKTYGLAHAWVVHNLPLRMRSAPQRTGLLRRSIGLQPNSLLFIYQGMLSPGRGIEVLIETFAGIGGDRHLVCMGYGPLEELVRQMSRRHPNIHFMPAVPPDQVKDYTGDADVGLSLIENTCLSYYLCAPNKLYEYAACGVAPVVSDFPEMSRFVDSYDCGWKVEPEVDALRRLVERIDGETLATKRINAARAGAQYCWENEEPELLRMYKALGLPGTAPGATSTHE
ncbi:glycosyltransferase family 4 protein [Herbaspirillum seropedicae]|uniref:glycosyltransferase family 4 protein n=1 Tax=Herbaspirillum seropedicae TaxID=964 RepID=UPI003FCC713F